MNYSISAERIIDALNTSMCIIDSLNKVWVLKNDEVLIFNQSNKLTLDNQTINDLLLIINSMNAEIVWMLKYHMQNMQNKNLINT